MSIVGVTIKNCKSIESLELNLKENINCFIGTNNVGKSNIMKALNFFYLNLTEEIYDESMFSKSNPYNDELEIAIEYDFHGLIKKMEAHTFNGLINPTNEIFEKIDCYIKKYAVNNRIVLSLKYTKNKKINWNIKDYEFRAFMAIRFPMFFLESRNINLYNWDSIWEVIGSIAPFRKKLNIASNISGIFEANDQEQDNYQEVIDIIVDTLGRNDIKIKKTNVYEKISQIIQLQLGGKGFNYDSHSLQLGSYGLNSYTFIKLYVQLILRLYEYKHLATPLIMIDEPELHLHVKKIEEFVRGIKENPGYYTTKWIFATHSPAFAKNIILENENYDIFHITNNPLYNRTSATKINGFKQRKYKLLSDNEANLFFSEACLFVEGDTELELFKNKNMRMLFPTLSKIDIYPFEGKNDKLQLVNPNDRKSKIKFLVLLDMDKLLSYVPKKKKYSITGNAYLNVLKDKNIIGREHYHYTKKLNDTFKTRIEIQRRTDNYKFAIDSSGLCIKEVRARRELIELIQQYFFEYNFFPLETTIEGAIININNYQLFYNWLQEYDWDDTNFQVIYGRLTTENQKASFLRVIFHGKSDWLSGEKERKKDKENQVRKFISLFDDIKNIRSELKKSNLNLDGKTSGWVTLFMNWFFEKEIDLVNKELYFNRKIFLSKFPELGKVIVQIEKMV
ncbi:AAA family ATPase [Bacillus thuringiensis]|nr:AAA family ATPase [Bacillus thuringiensis]HDR4715797.1 retron Eco8 family effector endonuclease [Bacillus cereus]HDR4721532.1 retron Eco8 family effector endonuclease [Bacillus cereus]HDR4925406.1 retron Eco8 family effector endonuclease [Bacillus cereus]HDT6579381.1 retron Eco8 family effector endonuclease [Bacillus cereus]